MIMMPYRRPWPSPQLTGQTDFGHPTGGVTGCLEDPPGLCGDVPGLDLVLHGVRLVPLLARFVGVGSRCQLVLAGT
jgi:hypothetical protein